MSTGNHKEFQSWCFKSLSFVRANESLEDADHQTMEDEDEDVKIP